MAQEVVSTLEAVSDIQIYQYFVLSAFTFLIYDHILTFDDEVEYFWSRPMTQGTIWFFLNRYVAFFGNVAIFGIGWVNFPEVTRADSCFVFNVFREVIVMVNLLIVCGLLIARTYALYNRSHGMLVFLSVTLISLVIIASWLSFGSPTGAITIPNFSGCYNGVTQPTSIRFATAFEANILFDTLIVFLTTFRTWKARSHILMGGRSASLIVIMLRDGALYYGAMALVNSSNVLTIYINRPFLRGCLSTFSSGMCATLMSRLMLNLHKNVNTVYIHNDCQLSSTLSPTEYAENNGLELKFSATKGKNDDEVENIRREV